MNNSELKKVVSAVWDKDAKPLTWEEFTVHGPNGEVIGEVVMASVARELERQVEVWKQLAESYMLSSKPLAKRWQGSATSSLLAAAKMLEECLEMSENWPGISYSENLRQRIKRFLHSESS